MAVRQIKVSDLSGAEDGVATAAFSFLDDEFEIDLTATEFRDLATVLEPYMAAGRRVAGMKAAKRGRGAARGGAERDRTAKIREWAQAMGMEVSARGRLPGSIVKDYENAMANAAAAASADSWS